MAKVLVFPLNIGMSKIIGVKVIISKVLVQQVFSSLILGCKKTFETRMI